MLAVGRQPLVESSKWNASKMSVGRSIAPDLADVFELWSSRRINVRVMIRPFGDDVLCASGFSAIRRFTSSSRPKDFEDQPCFRMSSAAGPATGLVLRANAHIKPSNRPWSMRSPSALGSRIWSRFTGQ
jgi:hypothetical protein